MLKRLPTPRFVHHVIALLRDGKWLTCPCCGHGFGTHQILRRISGPARLYNRVSYLCPTCVGSNNGKAVTVTAPRPCSCPDCGHVETSLVAMGRHMTKRHTSLDMCF
jgi:hypothetical protein